MNVTRCSWVAAFLTVFLTGCVQQPVQQAVVVPAKVLAPEPESVTVEVEISPQEEALSQALDQLGARYRYGGTSPEGGFDCSGLVHYAYQNTLSVDLPRSSKAMSRMDLPEVKRDDLQPGDLVFFRIGGQISHVGMYKGDGEFLHANRSGGKVRIDNLSDSYWRKHYALAKRVEVELSDEEVAALIQAQSADNAATP